MNRRTTLMLGFVLAVLAGCGGEQASENGERRTTVAVAEVSRQTIEEVEVAIGRLDAVSAPAVAAETAGRVAEIHRDAGDKVAAGDPLAELEGEPQRLAVNGLRADIRRLEALLENERRRVGRLQSLAEQQSVPQDQLDEAVTAVEAYEAQLDQARARLSDAEHDLGRTRIVSPVSGHVQRRTVSSGDFVATGQVLFEVVSPDALRAILPLPEHLSERIREGQVVRLTVPSRPDEPVSARINEIQPMVARPARSIELIVNLDNPGRWRAGGSVTGRVVVDTREAVVVPPISVVRRPAGTVVYVVDGDRAVEREVRVGLRHGDWVEITEGLEDWETVVTDGAGFLTDDAAIDIRSGNQDS